MSYPPDPELHYEFQQDRNDDQPLDTEEVERPDHLLYHPRGLEPAPRRLAEYALALEAQVEAYQERPTKVELVDRARKLETLLREAEAQLKAYREALQTLVNDVRAALDEGTYPHHVYMAERLEECYLLLTRHNEIEGSKPTQRDVDQGEELAKVKPNAPEPLSRSALIEHLHKARHQAPPGFDSRPEECETCAADADLVLQILSARDCPEEWKRRADGLQKRGGT